jgi:hypothetical protein
MHNRFILSRSSRDVKRLTALFCFCLTLPGLVYSIQPDNSNAFGDPDHIVKMDPDWQRKTISYDKNVGETDMLIRSTH